MRSLLIIGILFLCVCCGHRQGTESGEYEHQTAFLYPEIPDTIVDSLQRRAYLMRHFWDRYDFSDTSLLSKPDISEQGFVNYLYLLSESDSAECEASVDSFIRRSDSCSLALSHFVGLAGRYLYDTASPMHNEDSYVMLSSAFMKSKSVPGTDKAVLGDRIKHILKNKVGTPASDFSFLTPEGTRLSLYDVGATRLLLFFYEMGCDSCMARISELRSTPEVSAAVRNGQVRVMTVCVSGDEEQWKSYAKWMPKQWIMAYDEENAIRKGSLYDFKTLPSVYLLDADKKVILKDEAVSELPPYFRSVGR